MEKGTSSANSLTAQLQNRRRSLKRYQSLSTMKQHDLFEKISSIKLFKSDIQAFTEAQLQKEQNKLFRAYKKKQKSAKKLLS
jgi:hypothetical protein